MKSRVALVTIHSRFFNTPYCYSSRASKKSGFALTQTEKKWQGSHIPATSPYRLQVASYQHRRAVPRYFNSTRHQVQDIMKGVFFWNYVTQLAVLASLTRQASIKYRILSKME